MNILARYIHGSGDSTDLDVLYITDEIPDHIQCKSFCDEDPAENRNLAVTRDGIVVWCYKGFPDEVNNAVQATYPLHEQEDRLLIERSVSRDVPVKLLSVLRKVIMELRHTTLRRQARAALKGDYTGKIELLETTDLRTLEWTVPEKEQIERRKSMAFQLGQAMALGQGVEIYTKKEIAECYAILEPYLYRKTCSIDDLEQVKKKFLMLMKSSGFVECGNNIVRIGYNPSRYISLKGKEHDVSEVK